MTVTIIGHASLYLGDCTEILPTLPSVESIVTDQPYGSGWASGKGSAVGKFNWDNVTPPADWDVWSTDWISLCKAKTFAAFCPISKVRELLNAFGGGTLRFYIKTNPRPTRHGDMPSVEPIVIYPSVRFGGSQYFGGYNGDNKYHPTQKPIPLMRWLVEGVSAKGETILDPFMGSGSTGIAALQLGRKFIGIEKNQEYFDRACRRFLDLERQQKSLVG